ncbi:NUDIX hydrolase [Nocardia sp. 2]|uniref:NUDIX hydrolase n=1 Tax=Nocardia acididurans TaxID=2802282 RepID=A0ABS1LZM9_9NOCA|nr:NUDIX hydrolase [Nocardia acididurans]MBL1073724.1 NUDIX hydrolase [Nocardia acididurans]
MTPEQLDYIAGLPRKRMGSGILFVDDADRVLLVEPTYKDHWELPGGVVEAGESPYATAVREVREELGLTVTPGPLLVVDWLPPGRYPDDSIMYLFDGGVLGADRTRAITLQAEELRSWAWCDAAAVADRLPDRMVRRVEGALRARRDRTALYLEHGYAVG